MAGRDQAVSVYTNNEPIQLRAQGYNLTELRVADYVQLASNGLITNETTASEDPALVRGMVAALVHGLSDTIADPAAAYQISLGYVSTLAQADTAVQKQVLATSIDLWKAPRPRRIQPGRLGKYANGADGYGFAHPAAGLDQSLHQPVPAMIDIEKFLLPAPGPRLSQKTIS